jgi:hypothetical protein
MVILRLASRGISLPGETHFLVTYRYSSGPCIFHITGGEADSMMPATQDARELQLSAFDRKDINYLGYPCTFLLFVESLTLKRLSNRTEGCFIVSCCSERPGTCRSFSLTMVSLSVTSILILFLLLTSRARITLCTCTLSSSELNGCISWSPSLDPPPRPKIPMQAAIIANRLLSCPGLAIRLCSCPLPLEHLSLAPIISPLSAFNTKAEVEEYEK